MAQLFRQLFLSMWTSGMEDVKMFFKKIIAIAVGTIVATSMTTSEANAGKLKQHHKQVRHHRLMQSANFGGGGVMPPFAYIQFCVHHRAACSASSGHLAMVGWGHVKLTSRLQTQLASINSRVNSRMRATSDKGADKWSIGGKTGDCEDYAMTKRALLIAAGWPSRALSLTKVRTAWGEGHAVLSVRTSAGTLVLDNLARSVKSINSVPYSIVAMQGGSAMQWTRRSDL
jgi:predicted transglutaminase-like cysteine proteinase